MTVAPYDAIVIGSGFGGAVTACRLAEAGYRVLVLERGRRWAAADFPREPGDAWLLGRRHKPEREQRLDRLPDLPLDGGRAGSGGRRRIAHLRQHQHRGDARHVRGGWPPEITYQELAPHYAAVGRMMNVQPVPRGQWPDRTSLMHEAATATGQGDRFRPLDLAVNFDPGWTRPRMSRTTRPARGRFTNAEGISRGPASTSASATSAAPSSRETRSTSTTCRGPSTTAPRSGRSTWSVPSSREGGAIASRSERIEDGGLVPG